MVLSIVIIMTIIVFVVVGVAAWRVSRNPETGSEPLNYSPPSPPIRGHDADFYAAQRRAQEDSERAQRQSSLKRNLSQATPVRKAPVLRSSTTSTTSSGYSSTWVDTSPSYGDTGGGGGDCGGF